MNKTELPPTVTLPSLPDKFHDECAVFGIYGHEEAANLTYLGLYALQHRGQEASGIVAGDGEQFFMSEGHGPRRRHLSQIPGAGSTARLIWRSVTIATPPPEATI